MDRLWPVKYMKESYKVRTNKHINCSDVQYMNETMRRLSLATVLPHET